MSIRRIGAVEATPEDELIPLDEIAKRFGVHTDTVRRWIKADLVDGRNRVPGSRGEGSRYIVIRAVFERAMRQGVEPERTPRVVSPDATEVIDQLRQLGTEILNQATRLESAIAETRRSVA